MNRYAPHLYVIPEDDANRQLADGFVLHDQVKTRHIQVMQPAGGWGHVLDTFKKEYVAVLRVAKPGCLVMLIDFDGRYPDRRAEFDAEVPDDLKSRVFVVGSKQTPEILKKELGRTFEEIGLALADDCYRHATHVWSHEHLAHNEPDRLRLMQTVRPILFGS